MDVSWQYRYAEKIPWDSSCPYIVLNEMVRGSGLVDKTVVLEELNDEWETENQHRDYYYEDKEHYHPQAPPDRDEDCYDDDEGHCVACHHKY